MSLVRSDGTCTHVVIDSEAEEGWLKISYFTSGCKLGCRPISVQFEVGKAWKE